MRFVWAVAAFVLATLMIGAGIAQRTVFMGPTTESAAVEIADEAPYVVVDGAVFTSHSGSQTLRVDGDDQIFAAYGRTGDMHAWLAQSDYVQVSLDDAGEIRSELVPAAEPDMAPVGPGGSDLWFDEFLEQGSLTTSLQLPDDMSMLLASDGNAPAPTDLTLTWPTGVTTPWAGPLIVLGGALMLVGIVLYVLAVRHMRRSRGPRRKGLPMPVTEPVDLTETAADKGVITAAPKRRSLTRGKRGFVALPAGLALAVVLSACSGESWPDLAPTQTPSPTPTVIAPEGQGAPAVTEAQAERILERIAESVAAADEAADADLADDRLTGAALSVRETNYQLREGLGDEAALAPIPTEDLKILLPEAYDGWPRTFMAIVESGDENTTEIMTVTQTDPWSPYRLTYQGSMSADTELNVAPAYVGALAVAPDSPFLAIAPGELASAYADVIDNGDDSVFAPLFDEATDPLRAQIAADRTERLEAFNETGAETATMSFAAEAGPGEPVSLATLDSGAIVAVTVTESETVESTNEDAVIELDGSVVAQTLTGVESAPGIVTTYLDQLFFFVPAESANQQIELLGYSSQILNAEVIEE